jgi:hypothetical protein
VALIPFFFYTQGVNMSEVSKFMGSVVTSGATTATTTIVIDNPPASDYKLQINVGAVASQTGTTKVATVTPGSAANVADSPTALNVQGIGATGIPITAAMRNTLQEFIILGDDPSWKGPFVSTATLGISGQSGAVVSIDLERISRGSYNRP